MKPAFAFLPLLALTGCHVSVDREDAPVKTETREFERGAAEYVRAVVHMAAGELNIKGGAPKFLQAEFHTARMPEVTFDAKGARGLLEIRAKGKQFLGSQGKDTRWKLAFDSQTPLDLEVHLGAGETDLDLSQVALRSLQVHMGVGELRLNLDGEYARDVDVEVQGGVGRAEIRLPRKMGAQVDAKGGMGSMKVQGLQKESGSGFYVNRAYEGSKRQVRCKVRGGIGEVELIGDSE